MYLLVILYTESTGGYMCLIAPVFLSAELIEEAAINLLVRSPASTPLDCLYGIPEKQNV